MNLTTAELASRIDNTYRHRLFAFAERHLAELTRRADYEIKYQIAEELRQQAWVVVGELREERDFLVTMLDEWRNVANEVLEIAEQLQEELEQRSITVDRIGPYVVEDAQKPVRDKPKMRYVR